MRYMVWKNGKIIGQDDNAQEALGIIERDFNPKKKADYIIHDLEADEELSCVSDLLDRLRSEARQTIHARQKAMQRTPLQRSTKLIKRTPIKLPTDIPEPSPPKQRKRRRNDVIDDRYSDWLCTQPCVITGITAARGTGPNNMHAHHIHGRIPQNDYLQVPLLGRMHSWGKDAYHQLGRVSYFERHRQNIPSDATDILSYFETRARLLKQQYDNLLTKEHFEI